MARNSVLCPFYQTNPELGAPSVDVIARSGVPAVRGLHLQDMTSNPFPDKEVHARIYTHGDQWEMDVLWRGASGADEYFSVCKPHYDRLKALGIRHVSAGNEPHPPTDDHYRAANAFYLRWVELVSNYGLVPWIYDWGVGWPAYGKAHLYVESVRAARAAGGGMVVHLYGAPGVFRNTEYPDEHYVLRVQRQIDELYAVGLAYGTRWIVVGECGIDGGVIDWNGDPRFAGKPRLRGWTEWARNYWVYATPSGEYYVLDDARYWQQLSDYDDALKVMPEIRWAFPFVAHPRPDWADFVIPQTVLSGMAAKHGPVIPEVDVIPYYHSSRNGYRITDIVLHDTEGSAAAAEYWFRAPSNTDRSSAHVIVDSAGEILRLIPDEWAAHHAGFATVPGNPGINPNRFSLGLELEYPRAPASPAWPEAQLEAAADVVRDWCDKWGITAEHIWEHKTIDPARRSDPRNWDRAGFLRRVFPPVVAEPLPNDEQGPPALLAQKARWWMEQEQREREAGNVERAQAIRLSLIDLLYRLENDLG